MNKEITINELYDALRIQKAMGNGKKKILLAEDDEGNGYRPMYFTVTPMERFVGEDGENYLDYSNLHGISSKDALENYIVIG